MLFHSVTISINLPVRQPGCEMRHASPVRPTVNGKYDQSAERRTAGRRVRACQRNVGRLMAAEWRRLVTGDYTQLLLFACLLGGSFFSGTGASLQVQLTEWTGLTGWWRRRWFRLLLLAAHHLAVAVLDEKQQAGCSLGERGCALHRAQDVVSRPGGPSIHPCCSARICIITFPAVITFSPHGPALCTLGAC